MGMPERAACDQAVRDRVSTELGTTFLLEAGAGTGKTKVLVDRYVRCVLDPVLGTGDVRTVAAITFTEKAAGELRQRVREELEARAECTTGSAEAAVVERALDALDDAPIGTIHGFAGRLLREFPVEAGVDPAFEQLDQLGAEIERTRLWEEWLTTLADAGVDGSAGSGGAIGGGGADRGGSAAGDGVEGCDPTCLPGARLGLARLLRAGVSLATVRALAVGSQGVFGERYDIDRVAWRGPEPDLGPALDALAAPVAGLREYCARACRDHSDKGFLAAQALAEACDALIAAPRHDADRVAATLFALPVKESKTAPGGARAGWDDAAGGKAELRERYLAVVGEVAAARDTYATFITGLAVAVADAFARWAGAAQIALGRLDFTDLLGRLRDLLTADRVARGTLQRRFRYILVDEFQDTDPLQAEIALLLCEREPVAAEWRDVVLQPGKLFVVGDPKQSIYRFRRADIALYDEVKRLVLAQPDGAGVVEQLRQNFRTTPTLVDWVNTAFDGVFGDDAEPGRQPRYQPVEAYRPEAVGARVAVLLGREYAARSAAGGADAARRDEAATLAALLVAMHDGEAERWRVQDRAAPLPASGLEPTRTPRWGDIALLFRATTGLEIYEQALREAGVPYRVEGGKTYFSRREVADALLCLRAADDPSDGPALYGALHSSYFGVSDDDLVLFRMAGGSFDVFAAEQPEGYEAIVAGLATLRELHLHSREREPHETVAELVRLTCTAEFLAATGVDAPQAIANLEKLVEQARAFTRAGGGSLGAFVEWAATAGEAAGEQESQVDDEGDVVHLLTIHKAKGLEFPIVVLVGGASGGGGGGGESVRPIVDRAGRRLTVKLKAELPGATARDLEPAEYRALNEREKEMAASEMRRLLYVAATRARDRLVVSCFGKLTTQKGEPAAVLLGPLARVLPEAGPEPPAASHERDGMLVLAPVPAVPPARRGGAADAAAQIEARTAWLEERGALLERAARPVPAVSPSGLEQVDDEVRAGGPGAPPGRARALALGTAVHEVLRLCDLTDESSLAGIASGVTRELGHPDLAERAAALAGACWRSAPVRAAAASPEVYRELPVGVVVEGTVLNGAVDLLYRDGEDWVIVDYKTDRVSDAGTLLERYTPQGAAYAVAVEAATGGVVREVAFVAAAAGGVVVTVPVDAALRGRVAGEVAAALRRGGAIRADELGDGREGDGGPSTEPGDAGDGDGASPDHPGVARA